MEFEFDDYTCSQFFFNNENNEELFFFTATEIIKLKYTLDDDREETIYTLKNYLVDPPNFGIFNMDQTKCIITSRADILFIDMLTKRELDIDDKEGISDIMNVIADDKYFYILANKKDNVIGYYLIMMEIDRPERGDTIYLINWKNKTSIQQVDLNFL